MNEKTKRPFIFFIVSSIFLIVISFLDYETFHFLTDFFSIFIGLMMFIIAINSRVFSSKSIYLVLAVSYLYVTSFELMHLLTFTGVGVFGENLNHSYQYFASARMYEAISLVIVFLFINKPEKLNYKLSNIIGASVFIGAVLLIHFEMLGPHYIVGIGQTTLEIIANYITSLLFIVSIFLIYRSNLEKNQKDLLILVLILKAVAQILHIYFIDVGDIFQITAMMFRFASYAGLYIVFIRQTVNNPYMNVYKLFETKEKELISLSQRDSLTGVYNHSLTFQRIEETILKIGSDYKNLCVILFDIDNFKQINDTYGHMKGDEILTQITSAFDKLGFQDQLVGRYGGDEFVLAIPNFSKKDVANLFERINEYITNIANDTGIKVTFSAGVVLWKMGDNATDLIRKADIKMYQSKENGKNQYTIWQNEL